MERPAGTCEPLVVVAALIAGCAGPPDRPPEPPAMGVDPARAVEQALGADLTPEARMRTLEPYIDVGRTRDEVERVLGPAHSVLGRGPGSLVADYHPFRRPGLRIGYYPDGEVYSVAYRAADGTVVTLRSDDPVTLPKTTDGKNAQLRKKLKRG